MLLLIAYVDDIALTSSSNIEINEVIKQLNNKFLLKDLGDLHFFLSIEVHQTSHGMFLTQKKHITELLHEIGMIGAIPTPMPMVGTPKLTSLDSSPFEDNNLYRNIIGTLQYVCIRRVDLAYCVNKLS